ncbi:MAG TPA: hypothetical protein VLG14_04160 [Sphingomonas sp.]|nr:hypothetical protein [Sphingomonas sp.]
MGLIIAVLGLIGLATDSSVVRVVAVALAAATFMLFGWRMVMSFSRLAAKADRNKAGG